MINKFFEDTKPGGQLLALGLIFVLFFILSTGMSLVVGMFAGGAESLFVSLTISQIVTFAGTAVVFALLFYGKPLIHLGLPAVDGMALKLLASCLIIVCLIPMSDWLGRVNDSWHLPQGLASLEETLRTMGDKAQAQAEVFLMRDGLGALMCNLFVVALLPALCEELLFRGALQQLFCRMVRNPHVAIWLTAAVFSLFHGEIFAFLPRFVLGAALGYLFYYGGSLWFNVTAHFINNALAIIVFYLCSKGVVDVQATESLNAPWFLVLIGLAIAVFFFVMFFVKRKSHKIDF